MLIYKIVNTVNKKIYVGKTESSLKRRVACYRSDHKSGRHNGIYLYKAFVKYGFDNFRFEVLVDEISTRKELNYCEKYLIRFLNSDNKTIGYNSTEGGDGVKLFGESNWNFGKKKPHLTELNKSRTGLKLSDAHKAKINPSGRGQINASVLQ